MTTKHWIVLALVSLVWGATFFFNEILINAMGPWTVTAGRTLIGAVGIWIFAFATGKRIPTDWRLWRFYFVLGLFNYCLPFTAIAWGQQHITGGLASIINALNPMTILIVTHFWPGGERATKVKFIGIFIGFVGVAILTIPKLQSGSWDEILGYLAVFSATIYYAIAFNIVRRVKNKPPLINAASSLTCAAIIATVIAFTLEGTPQNITQPVVLSMLGLGIFSTAIAFSVMFYLMPVIGGVNFSTVTFMVPVSAIFLGTTILHEKIEPIQLAGMAVIFLGLIFIDGRLIKRFASAQKSS